MIKICIFFILVLVTALEISSNEINEYRDDHKKLKSQNESIIELIEFNKSSNATAHKEGKLFPDKTTANIIETLCLSSPCLRKCCATDEIYHVVNREPICSKNIHGIHATDMFNNKNTKRFISENRVTIFSSEIRPYCTQESKIIITIDNYNIILNGSINDTDTGDIVTIAEYCFEFVEASGESVFFRCYKLEDNYYSETNNSETKDDYYYDAIQTKYYPYFMMVSSLFLLLTVLVLTCISKLRNLVEKFLLALAVMLVISFLLLSLVMKYGDQVYLDSWHICKPIGYLILYSMLSSFFWLNVMCMDIWLVFSGICRPPRKLSKKAECNRFLKYAVYAWGSPFIICGITYFFEQIIPKTSPYNPGIGVEYCLLNKNESRIVFYYLPLTILLILNIAWFSSTAIIIVKEKKKLKVLKRDGSQVSRRIEKERLNSYFRLFLVMGIPWISDPISYYFNHKPIWLWVALDILNLLLSSTSIFLLFVCKRRSMQAIKTKFQGSMRCFSSSLEEEPVEDIIQLELKQKNSNLSQNSNCSGKEHSNTK